MNLQKIEAAVKQYDLPKSEREHAVLTVIADDPEAISIILRMMDIKLKDMEELIRDSNLEVSRALVLIEDKNLCNHKGAIVDKGWVAGEIRKHFLKWQHRVKCCFKMNGLP